MATIIVPVGHLLGPYFSSRTLDPDAYDIRLGDDVHNLSFDEYTVWSVAHGFPELVGKKRPSRPIIEAHADQLGVKDAPVVFERLLKTGLLARLMLRRHMEEFARAHRAYPLTVGLGNTATALEEFTLGRPEQPMAVVPPDVFHLWSYLPRFPSLWVAAEEVAQDLSTEDRQLIPEQVILMFLRALPPLLAMNCLYFDRV